MSACLFVGPTLRPDDVPAGEFALLPPVAQGDVYRAAQSRPRAIGIVDGFFEGVPAVWHKEILWAMAEGIHVFGSASMGALRAAELAPFGMRGTGWIYEAYRQGELEDDDEVAVIHGPAGTGYVALSEAMVNVRRTLAAAEAAGVIGPESHERIVGIAKALFYQERSWERILDRAGPEVVALRAWLPQGRVDQKRVDALAMVAEMQALLAENPAPLQVDYVLEWAEVWDDATLAGAASGEPAALLADERVLEELRLESATYRAVRERALLRFLAEREAARRRRRVSAAPRSDGLARLRMRHGLMTRAALDAWMVANGLDKARLERLLESAAQVEAIGALAAPSLRAALLDELRLRGEFARLAERARAKQAALEARGLDQPGGGAPVPGLRAWYFEERLDERLPDDVDAAARDLGFADCGELDRALHREWLYRRHGNATEDA